MGWGSTDSGWRLDQEDAEWLYDYEQAVSDGANDGEEGVFMEYVGDSEGDWVKSDFDDDPTVAGYYNGLEGNY